MRKEMICRIIILSILLTVSFRMEIITAMAAEINTETAVETGDGNSAGSLVLDDAHIYSGMKAAYKNGYSPVISKNKVQIVLPVYFKKATDVAEIQAGLDLGAADNSPFVYKNYLKTVKKTEEKIQNSKEKKEIFLVAFTVGLKEDRMNGTYPVIVRLSYDAGDAEMTQEFTVYVNIKDGKNPSDGTELMEETTPTSEPKVIVAKNTLSTEKILSGSDFGSTVTLQNTSKSKAVQNITITVSCEAEGISLSSDSNVFYYEKLGAGDTLELPLEFTVNENTPEGKYTVRLSMAYDNPQAASLSSEGEFYVQVYQKMRVGLEAGQMVPEINAGDSISVPIQVMNFGRGMIYNVRCNVEGTGLTASKSLFIGNLEGGTAGSGELVLFAGMVNADAAEEADRYGSAYGRIIMTYEDEQGNPYTEEQEYDITILPMEIHSSSEKITKKEISVGAQMIIGMIVLIGLVVTGTLAAVVIRRRNSSMPIQEEQENP